MAPDTVPIEPGTRLGHYEILGPLGKGGMGEVWRARDTTLRREVAIKTLPAELARDAHRVARLEREAMLLAALNHPNIAIIHGLEESGGTRFLVLELVDGPTLGDRLRRGPIPVGEAIPIALQIAESLEAAHDKGIIHRDLKPDNIKLTSDGRVKVLDFGLARAVEAERAPDAPTMTNPTATMAVVGTPPYMSPEQARGEDTDHRTDIWSFGAVLYQLLTGVSPFSRNTTADTIAQVIGGQPDFGKLDAPPSAVRRIVRRCLEKDLKRRYRDIGDVRIELEESLAAPFTSVDDDAAGASPPRVRRIGVVPVVVALLAVAAGAWLVGRGSAPVNAPSSPVRLTMPFLELPGSTVVGTRPLAISTDGLRVAYVSQGRLWIRRMDEAEPTVALDFAGESGNNPFFSPDGAWVGFSGDQGLIKVPVDGGLPIVIAPNAARPAGATWRDDGTIVFATTDGIFQVAEGGGEPRLVALPDRDRGERLYAWPESLPDGRSLLVTIVPEEGIEGAQIAVMDLETGEVRAGLTAGSSARYLPTGHLVYASGPTLRAIAFDPDSRTTRGDPVSLADFPISTWEDNGAASFAVSATGTLVHMEARTERAPSVLTWIDRDGKTEPLPFAAAPYSYPRVSPDGTRITVEIFTRGNRDIWVLDLERLTRTRLTNNPTEDLLPAWSPAGDRIYFASDRASNFDVYSRAADGTEETRVEYAAPGTQFPTTVTPDGTRIIVYENFQDLSVLDLAHPDSLVPLFHTQFDERIPQISPDGRWVAYESNEFGEPFQVFIRPFPDLNERRMTVSAAGGRYPLWSPTTDELFYVNLDGFMVVVPVTFSPTLSLGRERVLFPYGPVSPTARSGRPYDVSPVDGRFLMPRGVPPERIAPPNVSVVLHFDDELAERVPVP